MKMKIQKNIERKDLKKFLHKKNARYRNLAQMINISRDALFNKLNGYTEFKAVEIKKLADIFNLSPEQVYKFFISS